MGEEKLNGLNNFSSYGNSSINVGNDRENSSELRTNVNNGPLADMLIKYILRRRKQREEAKGRSEGGSSNQIMFDVDDNRKYDKNNKMHSKKNGLHGKNDGVGNWFNETSAMNNWMSTWNNEKSSMNNWMNAWNNGTNDMDNAFSAWNNEKSSMNNWMNAWNNGTNDMDNVFSAWNNEKSSMNNWMNSWNNGTSAMNNWMSAWNKEKSVMDNWTNAWNKETSSMDNWMNAWNKETNSMDNWTNAWNNGTSAMDNWMNAWNNGPSAMNNAFSAWKNETNAKNNGRCTRNNGISRRNNRLTARNNELQAEKHGIFSWNNGMYSNRNLENEREFIKGERYGWANKGEKNKKKRKYLKRNNVYKDKRKKGKIYACSDMCTRYNLSSREGRLHGCRCHHSDIYCNNEKCPYKRCNCVFDIKCSNRINMFDMRILNGGRYSNDMKNSPHFKALYNRGFSHDRMCLPNMKDMVYGKKYCPKDSAYVEYNSLGRNYLLGKSKRLIPRRSFYRRNQLISNKGILGRSSSASGINFNWRNPLILDRNSEGRKPSNPRKYADRSPSIARRKVNSR
ncbi:hypothetical protein, conserved [Plasmodium ovale]|uniref:Uncharacterized protein n=1 Tax=Plasmodium ovale TaxID=36330 RepID=A0A1C3KES5_PLAOA|nr:hypothetical protein, conserved [Plasmodium ovale]